MSVLIDSNVLIALINKRDRLHSKAKELLDKIAKLESAYLITIDYVLDEVLTTLWKHTKNKSVVKKAYNLICNNPDFITLEFISELMISNAWDIWSKYAEWPNKPLSFTDCCIVSFIKKNRIKNIATFDSDFNGLVNIIK